jgi:hypothetical protein
VKPTDAELLVISAILKELDGFSEAARYRIIGYLRSRLISEVGLVPLSTANGEKK